MMAPMVLDGPMNSIAFRAYGEQILVTTLSRQHRRNGQPSRS